MMSIKPESENLFYFFIVPYLIAHAKSPTNELLP